MLPMKKGALIFDLYGTLMQVTTRMHQYAILCRFLENGLEESEKPEVKKEFKRVFLTCGTSTDIVTSLLDAKPNFPSKVIDRLSTLNEGVKRTTQHLVEKEVQSVAPFDDLGKCLKLLSEHYDLILVSNLATPFKEPFLSRGYGESFKACIFSCDVGMVKPDVNIFKEALKHCDEYPNGKIMVIGDKMHTDGRGAEALNLHYFKSHGHQTFVREFTQFMLP